MSSRATLLLLLVCGAMAATRFESTKATTAVKTVENPIRKVVNMMKMMQTKIAAEGKNNKELYDKYMCYCENADELIGKDIRDGEDRIPQLEASIKASISLKIQLEAEVKAHQQERTELTASIKKQLEMFKKSKSVHVNNQDELKANIRSLERAIQALEKGTYGTGFLQTKEASVLRQLSITATLGASDRSALAAFLSGGNLAGAKQGYVPQAQEIIGILKQMLDEMRADLKDDVAGAASEEISYKEFYSINMKRITTLTAMIEAKLTRIGELGVQIAMLKNDLDDTLDGLAEDKKFLGDMEKNCEAKKREWAEYKKMQALELAALADTIAILDSDDALEMFKKTLPSSASLLQVDVSSVRSRERALAALASARAPGGRGDSRLQLLEMALRGKKIGFAAVIEMIDKLIALLLKEQTDDDAKKTWCATELDSSDDAKKAVDHTIADLETAIADAEETIASLKTEIDTLEDGIRALDKDVEEATEQRKEEHETFVGDLAANTAALELLKYAQNRLNKFYNPKLYKAPPKRELTEAERITVNNGGTLAPTTAPGGIAGTGVTVLAQVAERYYEGDSTSMAAEPATAPTEYVDADGYTVSSSSSSETVTMSSGGASASSIGDSTDGGANSNNHLIAVATPPPAGAGAEIEAAPAADLSFKKSSGANNGITALMNSLMSDLEKQMAEAKVNEADAQKDYEGFMSDSADKRAQDSTSISDKEGALAELEGELLDNQEALKAAKYELMNTEKYIMELHKECDWLLKYYGMRKDARAGEVESLKNAKDVLNGADYSL